MPGRNWHGKGSEYDDGSVFHDSSVYSKSLGKRKKSKSSVGGIRPPTFGSIQEERPMNTVQSTVATSGLSGFAGRGLDDDDASLNGSELTMRLNTLRNAARANRSRSGTESSGDELGY